MNKIMIKLIFNSFIALLIIMNFSSCEKSQYIDTGVFKNDFKGTNFDYLKSRPELFDSLCTIIEVAGLKEEINKQGRTFFTPPNQSIMKSVRRLNERLELEGMDTIKSLRQIKPQVWSEFLKMYIFTGIKYRDDYPQLDTNRFDVFPGQGYISIGNNNMNIGVIYNDVKTKNSEGQEQVVQYAGYRQLYISSVDVTDFFGQMINTPVSTSNIKTSNGVLHSLNFSKHTFGFSSVYFANRTFSQL